jgi:hypothetical protein
VFQLAAWIVGLSTSLGINAPYAFDTASVWWQGIVFGVLLYPGIWLLGFVLPRLTLNFASGAMIGGGISAVIAVFQQEWPFIVGSLVTLAVGYLTAWGQNRRVEG